MDALRQEQANGSSREKLLEALKKDPGRSAKNIARSLGLDEDNIRKTIRKLEGSEEPEIKKLLAKRKAYVEGGAQLAGIIKANPGASYQKLMLKLREEAGKENVRARDMAELFKGLIEYCRKGQDGALRETLVRHKKAGGWLPGAGSPEGIRYSEKVMEELRKGAGKTNREIGKAIGLSQDTLRDVLRKMRESNEPEALLLLSRREIYAKGGEALAEVLRASPGAKYPEIASQVVQKTGKIYDIAKIFRGLADHCKRQRDKEVMGILIAHKKAGGWIP